MPLCYLDIFLSLNQKSEWIVHTALTLIIPILSKLEYFPCFCSIIIFSYNMKVLTNTVVADSS